METKEKQVREPIKIKLRTVIILISIILFIIICMIVFRNTNIIFTTNGNFESSSSEAQIPNNAVEITDDEWIDIMYGQFFAIPVTVIICIIIFILTKKYPNEDKAKIQEKIKSKKTVKAQVLYGYKYMLTIFLEVIIMFIPIMIIHEFIHLFMMALFGIENIYVVFEGGILINSVYSDVAKWQILLIQLMPSIFFVIMIITTVILYTKSNKKSVMMLLLILAFCGLCSATPDWMGAYNVITIVPNGARFVEILGSFYYINIL